MQINIHQAKSTLSKLVVAAEETGQETTLCRAGKPVAKIIPLSNKPVELRLTPGVLAGQIEVSEDFDAFLGSEAAIFGINVPK